MRVSSDDLVASPNMRGAAEKASRRRLASFWMDASRARISCADTELEPAASAAAAAAPATVVAHICSVLSTCRMSPPQLQ